MAGMLASLIPGLLSSAGGGQGIFSKIKDMAGSVIGDIVNKRVHSAGDFGRSLLGGVGSALGLAPPQSAQKAPFLTENGNAADHKDVMATATGHRALLEQTPRQRMDDPAQTPAVHKAYTHAPEDMRYSPDRPYEESKANKQAAKYRAQKAAKKQKHKARKIVR